MHYTTPPGIYRQITVEATAYSIGCGGGLWTANHTHVREGIIAVDPALIRLGTKIVSESDELTKYIGTRQLDPEDTGGAIQGARIDIWMNTCQKAIDWGRRQIVLQVFQSQHVTRMITRALATVAHVKRTTPVILGVYDCRTGMYKPGRLLDWLQRWSKLCMTQASLQLPSLKDH